MTATMYEIIKSELNQAGFDEFVNDQGELVYFEPEYQFIHKIRNYDEDVENIVTNHFFTGLKLATKKSDQHFKRTFINRFANRQIKKQTIDSFAMDIGYVFMTNEKLLNELYDNVDRYIGNSQQNEQFTDGETESNNRSLHNDLPQNRINLNVKDDIITSANTNTISKSNQLNKNKNHGETKNYRFDELIKLQPIFESIFNQFDKKCFAQFW